MSEMTTPQILRAAATHIETYGWEKGRLHGAPKTIQRLKPSPSVMTVGPHGPVATGPIETVSETTYDYSSACTLGALEVVTGVYTTNKYGGGTIATASPEYRAYSAAVRAFELHLYETVGVSSIPGWNDSIAQRAEEVVARLRQAADVIEFRQRQAMGRTIDAAQDAAVALSMLGKVSDEALAAIKAMAQTWKADEAAEADQAPEPTPEADAVAALNEAAAVIEAAQSETVSA